MAQLSITGEFLRSSHLKEGTHYRHGLKMSHLGKLPDVFFLSNIAQKCQNIRKIAILGAKLTILGRKIYLLFPSPLERDLWNSPVSIG